MYLKLINFSKILPNEGGWEVKHCNFNDINLIAGRNASGKTRLLKTINSLVQLLSRRDNIKTRNESELQWQITLQDSLFRI